MLTPRSKHPDVSDQQYAVVLVNEDQLGQLMGKPPMRRVNSGWAPGDVYARYRTFKRRITAAAIVLLVLLGGGLVWMFAPEPAMASMFPWSRPPVIPSLYTGASFSVTIASVGSADAAGVAASRIRGVGLPAFTRRSPGKYQTHQAMVGPFASLDEAEKIQRRLGTMGYRGARIFVDESLRSSRGEPSSSVSGNPGVLLLGAPDRVSLVLELENEPRQVKSSRPDATTLEVDAGPMPTPAHPQQWSAPDGVHLLQTVSIETLSAQGGLHYLRARMALPAFAKANVRTEGRRVYVDLMWPVEDENAARPPSRAAATSPVVEGSERSEPIAASSGKAPGPEGYRAVIEPVHQRVAELKPFLISAAQSGSPDVHAALDQTLATLEASLVGISVPPTEAGQHQLLLTATREARRGLEPGFSGDRLAHVQKAITLFDGAIAAPVVVR